MKMLGKSSVSSVLSNILSIAWILWLIAGLFLFFYSTKTIIDPGKLDFRSFREFSFLYALPSNALVESIQINNPGPDILKAVIKPLAELHFNTRNRWFILNFWSVIYIYYTLVLLVMYHLRGFLESLKTGNPFIKKNAGKIRIIGLFIIGAEILRFLSVFGFILYLKNKISIPGSWIYWESFKSHFNLGTLFLGFVILVIAEIFRLGAKLQEEQELTI